MSVVQSCRASQVEPFAYVRANRQRIASLFPTAHRFALGKLEPTAHRFAWVRSRQCQGFPRNPGRFHPGSGLSPSLDQLGAIEREASFL